jgi:hypothetical protein
MVLCPVSVRNADPANDNGAGFAQAITQANARFAYPATRQSVLDAARWFEDAVQSRWTSLLLQGR